MYSPPSNKKPVHMAKHLHKIPVKKRVFPCIGDIKKDGVYAYQIVAEGDFRIFSRTGMQYRSLKHLEEAAERLWNAGNIDAVIIYEVYTDKYPVNKISGNCRTQSRQHPELHAVVHDIIPLDDFIAGRCEVPYAQRKEQAERFIAGSELFRPSQSFTITSEERAQELFQRYANAGEEGIIGRDPAGIWIAGKKNEYYWKIKLELSYDLEVTGMALGKGKYSDTLGTLIARFRLFGKKDGEVVTIQFSGMTDEQRHTWWNDARLIIGQIVKVDAMTFTAYGMLREPRFKEVRKDKIKADF